MALFSCPKCSWRVKITDKDLGKKGKCLQCASEFVFPSAFPKDVPVTEEKPAPGSAHPRRPAQMPAWLKPLALTAAVIAVIGIVAAIGFFTLGGSDPSTIVVGTVKYQDKPLTSGTISFIGENSISQASIGRDGAFRITDAPLGQVKVTVRNRSTSLKKQKGEKIKWEVKSLIPTKYNDPELSGLKYTISTGRQEIHIELTD
jgi:hypothetical protein